MRRILHIKHRPQAKGVILIAANIDQLRPFVEESALLAAYQAGYWPGPVTLLLPAAPRCPIWVRGQHRSVAVRITDHPIARDVCNKVGHALVSTSANRAGQQPIKHTRELLRRLGAKMRRVAGRIGNAKRPSRIIDWSSGRVVRT